MFFQFAVSTGLLINAKISVQAAADAAAYAGAAVQARQMNGISYLSYDMRRQYKKFLFRYAFVGTLGNSKQQTVPPSSLSDSGFNKDEAQNNVLINKAINVPVICIPLTDKLQGNDNCSNVSLPNTAKAIGGGGSINSITQSLIDQLNAIGNLQNKLCGQQGQLNLSVALAWLFRADVSNSAIRAMINQLFTSGNTTSSGGTIIPTADLDNIVNNLSPLFGGLGLYPRNIINYLRATTLQKFINEPHAQGLTQEIADSWRQAKNAEAKERSLQAFYSASANLNGNVFDSALMTMDELQPDSLLTIQPVQVDFNVYIQHMDTKTGLATAANGDKICNSFIDPFPALGAPVGLSATSPPRVSYAVHLKAFIKPHGLLYLPNSEPLELDAYAGAKPFGSRIGPASVDPSSISKVIKRTLVNADTSPPLDCSNELNCTLPYLYITGMGTGSVSMFSAKYIDTLQKMAKGNNNAFDRPGILKAQAHALAPTPVEVGHFNILPPPLPISAPPGKPSLSTNYIPYAQNENSTYYQFYAPVFPDGGGDVNMVIKNFIDKMFEVTQVSTNDNAFNIDKPALHDLVLQQTTEYINSKLDAAVAGTTENGETLTFASLELPEANLASPNAGPLSASPDQFWLTLSSEVLTSWGPGATNAFRPRFGYSVKFVTLRDLAAMGVVSDTDDLSIVNH